MDRHTNGGNRQQMKSSLPKLTIVDGTLNAKYISVFSVKLEVL
jgi:hypothetical protein